MRTASPAAHAPRKGPKVHVGPDNPAVNISASVVGHGMGLLKIAGVSAGSIALLAAQMGVSCTWHDPKGPQNAYAPAEPVLLLV